MNSAVFGGVFHLTQSGVYLSETKFKDNKANRGGCIDIGYHSYISMNKVSFQNNLAYSSAGVIYIQSRSYFQAINSDFTNNKAKDSSYGLAEIKDVSFTGTPGVNYSISVLTEAIDKNKKSNYQYMQARGLDQIDFKIEIQLREQKMTEPGNCIICPEQKAICQGGSNIGPKKGYWRRMIPPQNDPKGACKDGYQGILCQDCQIDYSKVENLLCQKCPKTHFNVLRLLAVFLLTALIVTFLIRSTLNGAKDKRNITSIYLKILMNHLQVIVLTAQFEFQWPQSKAEQIGRTVSTIIIILFLVHPSIVQYMFSNFSCMTIDSDQRIQDDLEVKCWSDFHNFISYFIAIPSIIVWGIGIPFFALILLFRLRSKLDLNILRLKKFIILSEEMKFFFFCVILISNLVFFVHWIKKMSKEVQFNLMTKMPKLYLLLFMFNNNQRFQMKLNEVRIKDESDNLLDEFDSSSPQKIETKKKLRKERKLKVAKILDKQNSIDDDLLSNDQIFTDKETTFSSNKRLSESKQQFGIDQNQSLKSDDLSRQLNTKQKKKKERMLNQMRKSFLIQRTQTSKQNIKHDSEIRRNNYFEQVTKDQSVQSKKNHIKSLFSKQPKNLASSSSIHDRIQNEELNFQVLQQFDGNESQIQDDEQKIIILHKRGKNRKKNENSRTSLKSTPMKQSRCDDSQQLLNDSMGTSTQRLREFNQVIKSPFTMVNTSFSSNQMIKIDEGLVNQVQSSLTQQLSLEAISEFDLDDKIGAEGGKNLQDIQQPSSKQIPEE
ncbi:UNKNOWN [Stylonychia lemnae]|uniref:Transmembrane protein n=1 Tax=Stylonychia lemnae TaxID=5949 RepID=A0A078AA66_STYLE|nr:UNKNOWN [Stylonychia lemnae]|eukprot:CDW79084.1 UNKNOWN [Stylonychia lemnae]